MTPTTVLSVAMEARQWDTVITLLNEVSAPHRVTNPIIQSLLQQLMPREPDKEVVQMYPQRNLTSGQQPS